MTRLKTKVMYDQAKLSSALALQSVIVQVHFELDGDNYIFVLFLQLWLL